MAVGPYESIVWTWLGAQPWAASALWLWLHLSSMVSSSLALRYSLLPPSNSETFFIHVNPPAINRLKVHSRQSVYFNCTKTKRYFAKDLLTTTTLESADIFTNASFATPHNDTAAWKQNTTPSLWVMVFSSDDRIAVPMPWEENEWGADTVGLWNGGGDNYDDTAPSHVIMMPLRVDEQQNFSVHALHVGRVTMSVTLVDKNSVSLADNGKLAGVNLIQAVAASEFPLTTARVQRTADLVFDSSAAAIAILISFGVGCCTDTESVKKQLKYPVSLIIGFCCQFILMPVLAFGLAMLLPLDKDIRFGLLCVACVPGGGLGHIAVVIGDGDIPLSLTMNMISVVAMLGTAPLWIFVLGQYFQSETNAILSPRMIPIYNFEIWLASIFFAYATGLVVNRFRPVVADALLNWVIKPLLLLATILYITLGVYINMYVFELINNYAVLGAILLPVCGCVLGFTLAAVCRQKLTFIKTIALETSSLNCLIVLAALRFSLSQPDADLASMIPIWVMFTIPGLYLSLAILRRCKNTTKNYWNQRMNNEELGKSFEITSTIVVAQPGVTALSAPLVVADGADDESGINNEKVTVL